MSSRSTHKPRKRFGQHFLVAPEYINRIIDAVNPAPGDRIVEIGPGEAALTAPLAASGATLHAVEFDRDLAAQLRKRFADAGNVMIHEADALEFDFASLGAGIRLVGNLPYNISTPLLFHLLAYADVVDDLHFMLQKEVVARMAALPGSKQYGRLTIMLGCRMEILPLFDVPPGAFLPPPRVVSSVVRMRPRPLPGLHEVDEDLLARVVRQAFSRRRKTLRNALEGFATVAQIEAASLDPGARPEQVSPEAWLRLVAMLAVTN